jgi:hypothetical protein
MKRISFLLVLLALCLPASLRAQDAVTEERLNKLSGRLEDIIANQEALNKRMNELESELRTVREQANKPTPDFASQEDLKRVADAVKEVDRKRMQDNDTIKDSIRNLGKTLKELPTPSAPTKSHAVDKPSATPLPDDGFEYIVQKGDTIEAIIAAYKAKGVKVTRAQLLKANPKLKTGGLKADQKIIIPDYSKQPAH